MSDIETLAEGEAFMDAVDAILGLHHPLRDVEIARLRRVWIAGRDYQRARGVDAEALREVLDAYVCGYCNNRVGYTPENGSWSPYSMPCGKGRGCAPLREALAVLTPAPTAGSEEDRRR